jgi:inner membrane protein
MDNLTHAALGLSAGVVVARKGGSLPAAAVAAFLAAEIPDIDVFIRSADDPLSSFRWHRHFTHSFSFMPIWAIVCAGFTAWLFKWINKPGINWKELIIPSFVGALTHLLCDGCTSYGTMLLWPFNEIRYAWDCLPIVDLFATLPLLILTIIALRKSSKKIAAFGLIWFCSYAGLGIYQHARAEKSLRAWLNEQKISPERLAVKPTISNLILWRGVWLHEGEWQVAAVRVVPFTDTLIAPGEKRLAWTLNSAGNPPPGSESEKMIKDFTRFTQGWNAYSIKESGILIGDIRFAMLPDSARSLWSVYYGAKDKSYPGSQVADVIMDRQVKEADWTHLKDLLLGKDKNYQKVN